MNYSVIITSIKFGICGVAFLSTFYTIAHFTFFLSNPNYNTQINTQSKDDAISIARSLLVNMVLLSVFILQHSLMAHPNFKNLLLSYKIDDLQRGLYVLCTALSLQLLISFWQVIPSITLWNYTFSDGPLWWIYIITHSFIWILLYICTIFMDIGELLGYKQVYYGVNNLGDPLNHKSQRLRKLYKHMRHPGFVLFIIIFWGVPIMSLDRILLSTILSLYMYIAFRTDVSDYDYQRMQYLKKISNLH